jgi:exodeoxyribonuclease VII large subunit
MPVYSLTELNSHIKETIDDAYPEAIWIRAEVISLNVNSFSGHCYLELGDGPGQAARARAMIWKRTFDGLKARFEVETGMSLEKGMMIQWLVKVEFNIQYGLSLVVWDIDNAFSLGQQALKKKQVQDRLRKEGLWDLNRQLSLELPCQRIAVISSPTAAGWEDFRDQLIGNEWAYAFDIQLFAAQMQGAEAGKTISTAFREIQKRKTEFDVIVLIRGGGSGTDLQLFDEFELCKELATSSLPVITGVGHLRDESIADQVAWKSLKTPTAVAQFLIDEMIGAESKVDQLRTQIGQQLNWKMRSAEQQIGQLRMSLAFKLQQRVSSEDRIISQLRYSIADSLRKKLHEQELHLVELGHRLALSNPLQILQKGYARVYQQGNWIQHKNKVIPGVEVKVHFQDGSLTIKP